MRYENLNHLVRESSSTRRYFLSLPAATQTELHEYNDYIHTAAELRRLVSALENCHIQVQLSEYYHF